MADPCQFVALLKNHYAEVAEAVEIGNGGCNGIPGHIMLLHRQIAGFKAVCPNLSTGGHVECREKQANKGKGNLIRHLPAVGGFLGRKAELRLSIVGHQSDAVITVFTVAQIEAAVYVPLKIKIAVTVCHGGEEELHTAVLPDVFITGSIDCTYVSFVCVHTKVYALAPDKADHTLFPRKNKRYFR